MALLTLNGNLIQAEEVSSSAATGQDSINEENRRLRRHLGVGDYPGQATSSTLPDSIPLCFIEIAPRSRDDVKCKLPSCSDRIEPGQLPTSRKPGHERLCMVSVIQ